MMSILDAFIIGGGCTLILSGYVGAAILIGKLLSGRFDD